LSSCRFISIQYSLVNYSIQHQIKMMKIGITLSALTAVSFADCNGVYHINGMAMYPVDACFVDDTISFDYTCDGDDGYMNVYTTDDCSGNAANSTGISDDLMVCDASSDCSYSTWSGYVSNTTDSCDADDGVYQSVPLVTECSDLGNMSAQISCDPGDSSSLVTYYDSDDCSGNASTSTSLFDVCLVCQDGAVAMTVKVVQVLAVVMWIAMA